MPRAAHPEVGKRQARGDVLGSQRDPHGIGSVERLGPTVDHWWECTAPGRRLAAALLQGAGVHVGERLMEANWSNPRGHFEDMDFVELQRAALERLGCHRDGWTTSDSTGASRGHRSRRARPGRRQAERGPALGMEGPENDPVSPALARAAARREAGLDLSSAVGGDRFALPARGRSICSRSGVRSADVAQV